MDTKVGIVLVAMVLSVMFAGELIGLSAQNLPEITTQKTQSSNDTTSGDITTGTRVDNVIRFADIIALGIVLTTLLASLITLFMVIKSNKTENIQEMMNVDTSNPDEAKKLEEIIQAIQMDPNASLMRKTIAEAHSFEMGEQVEKAIEKWGYVANIAEGIDNLSASFALRRLGCLYVQKGIGKKALSVLDKSVDLKPDSPEVYNYRGLANALLGKNYDAIRDYKQAIRLNRDYAEAYTNLGITRSALGEHEEAVRDHDKAIHLNPDYAEAHVNRAEAKNSLNQHDAALNSYTDAIDIDPDYAEAYYKRGKLKQRLGRSDEALIDYNKAVQIKPDYADVYVTRGLLKHIHQDEADEAALADYDKAIELKPDYAGAYTNRGSIKRSLGQHEEALADYTEAIRIKPDYVNAYANRCLLKLELGRVEEAMADGEIAVELADQQGEDNIKTIVAGRLVSFPASEAIRIDTDLGTTDEEDETDEDN